MGIIRSRTNDVFREEQCDSRCGRRCVDKLFVVRQLCEKFLAKGNDLFWAFIYLEKAYERVDRNALWQVMILYGVGGKLLKAVQFLCGQ